MVCSSSASSRRRESRARSTVAKANRSKHQQIFDGLPQRRRHRLFRWHNLRNQEALRRQRTGSKSAIDVFGSKIGRVLATWGAAGLHDSIVQGSFGSTFKNRENRRWRSSAAYHLGTLCSGGDRDKFSWHTVVFRRSQTHSGFAGKRLHMPRVNHDVV